MSRLDYITNEYMSMHKGAKEDGELIQKYLNRLKTFEEKDRFLNHIKESSNDKNK